MARIVCIQAGYCDRVTAATKDVLAAKGLVTTFEHQHDDGALRQRVPEATRRGMEQIEVLCSKREVDAPEEQSRIKPKF